MAANLHLVVGTTDVLQLAIGQKTRQIAGAIQAAAVVGDGVGQKHRRSACRVGHIATSNPHAGDEDFTHRTARHRLQFSIEQVQTVVQSGATNRHTAARLGQALGERMEGHVVGAFGRPVGVHQRDAGVALEPAPRQRRWQRLASGQYPAQCGALQACLEQALHQRRHRFENAHAMASDSLGQGLGVLHHAVAENHRARPQHQAGEGLPDGDVEALRRALGDHVIFIQAQARQLAKHVVEHAGVGHHRPLGRAGGARGEDAVGQRQAMHGNVQVSIAVAAQGRWLVADRRRRLRHLLQRLLCQLTLLHAMQQQRRTALGEHLGQALRRIARVQWQPAGASLECGEDHHHQVEATLIEQRQQVAVLHAIGAQMTGQSVGLPVQLIEAQAALAMHHGDSLGGATHLLLQALDVQRLQLRRVRRQVTAGPGMLLGDLRRIEHGDALQRDIRLADQAVAHVQQQRAEVAQHLLDFLAQEPVGLVGQLQVQALAGHDHHGNRIVGVGAVGHVADQVVQLALAQAGGDRRVLEDEQALEQILALYLAPALDLRQRHAFMFAQAQVLDLQGLEPGTEGLLRLPAPAQRQAVDEQPDDALHALHVHRAPGHGDAEQQVTIAAVARQHQGPGTLHQGVEGDAQTAGGLLQALCLLDAEVLDAILHRLRRIDHAARVAETELGGGIEAGQALLPEGLMILRLLLLQPADEVAVRAWLGQLQTPPFTRGAVTVEKVHHDDGEAPGIHEDVVIAAHELVGVRGQLEQAHAHQRCLGEIQPLATLLGQQMFQTRLLLGLVDIRPVLIADRQFDLLVHHLHRPLLLLPDEGGAQQLVALHHLCPGLAERLQIELRQHHHMAVLQQVHALARVHQAVKQQPLLHGSQGIDGLDIAGKCFDLIVHAEGLLAMGWGCGDAGGAHCSCSSRPRNSSSESPESAKSAAVARPTSGARQCSSRASIPCWNCCASAPIRAWSCTCGA